jgi:hypothetical protein
MARPAFFPVGSGADLPVGVSLSGMPEVKSLVNLLVR